MCASRFLLAVLCLWPHVVWPDPIALRITPPKLPSTELCAPVRRLEEVKTTWATEAWPDHLSSSEIRRDISTLRTKDAAGSLSSILRMISGLSERDSKFAGKYALLAEIDALHAAGAFGTISSQKLVPRLAALSDGSSSQVLRALARFFREGVGVEPDPDVADVYLVAAGHLGHPDALMTLASRHLEGDAPTDWVQAPEASVRLAFENLLTPLNGKICDRSKRIARAYLNSEVVQKDAELGQGWLQFAASLGDAQAAWKIYELQRKAEEVAPNTALRLRYLKQAAGAGLPYAKIALGQVYERGALLPKDLNRALSLYRDVARTGDRAGQVRLALFLEEHKWTYPELRAEKGDILKALTERSDAPPWAFTRLAHYVAQSLGPWNATSRNLLVTAVDLGDREALMRLASLLLADRTQPSNFDAAVDFLTEAVSLHGSTGAAKKLYDAYMCKSPYAPEVAEAGFWRAQYLAADPPLLSDRGSRSYPALQAQALYLRPSALRLWFDHLDRMDARDPMALFWEDYAAGFAQMRDAQRVLAQSSTLGLQEKADFSALLAKAFSSGNPSGLTKLLDALGQNSNKLEPLLLDYARDGSGAAVRLLAHRRDEDLGSTVKSLLPDLLRMGDFEALLLAAPFAVDRARVLDRAIGIMPCDFKSAMQIARVAGRIGDFDRLKQYLSIAENLHEDKPWALMHLADAVLQWQGFVAAHRAAALYKRAFEAGEVNAGRKWLALLSLPETGVYDQTKARLVSQRLAELAGGL